MLPSFRSRLSAGSFCILLLVLLGLPVVTKWVGHPSREQAYASMSGEVGPIGIQMREIYRDQGDVDILFLGSSLLRNGLDTNAVQQSLSQHLGRPAHVAFLAFNWQGLDLQYFTLRDYLDHHKAKLIIWNLPVPGSRNIVPHVEAFHWIRYGEYGDSTAKLPLRYRLTLYGDMVLGAPRELLSHIRKNRLSEEEWNQTLQPNRTGYYGAPFVPMQTNVTTPAPIAEAYEDAPYADVSIKGPPLNAYEKNFARQIYTMARQHGVKVILLHIPIDQEKGLTTMPERADWPAILNAAPPMIGVTSTTLFQGRDPGTVNNFYYDQHFNANGKALFTQEMIPALLKAYDSQEAK